MRQLSLALQVERERTSHLLRWLPQLSEGEYRGLRALLFRGLELAGFGVAHKETNRALVSLATSAWRHGKPLAKTSEELAGVLQEDNGPVRGTSPDAVDRHLRSLASIDWLYWPAPVWCHGSRGGFYTRRKIRPAAALVAIVTDYLDAIINRRWKLQNRGDRAGSGPASTVPRSRGSIAVSGAVQILPSCSKEGTDGSPPSSGPPYSVAGA